MRTILHLSLLAVLAVAACGEAQTPTPKDVQTGQAEGLPPMTDPPEPPPTLDGEAVPAPGAAPTVLQPIVRADWEGRTESGSGCNLSVAGRDYVVVVVGDGVAKLDGTMVDLSGVPGDFDGLTQGGRFTAGGTTIDIALAPERGEGDLVDEVSRQPVRVTVTSGGATERFDAAWSCGG